MGKVAIYCRKSVEDPKSNSVSIAEQKQRGAALAKEKHPKLSVEFYIDNGISGQIPPRQFAKPNQKKFREEFTRLIDDIEKGEIQVLICRRVDRLARNMAVQQRFFENLPTENFKIYFVDEPHLNYGTVEGELQLNILSAIAEFERKKVETNIRAAKKYAKDNGLKLGGAYWVVGYKDSPDGKFAIDEKGKEAVENIYKWFLDGVNYADITRKLNIECPDAHPPNKSNMWYQSTVKRMLQAPRYIGKAYNTEGLLIDSQVYDPIIDQVTWNKCARKVELIKGLHGKVNHGINLFGDVLICGNCGNRLVLYSRYSKSGERVGREYKCIEKKCTSHSATLMEGVFVNLVYSLFFWDLKETKDETVQNEIENKRTELVGAKDAVEKITKRLKVDASSIIDELMDALHSRKAVVAKIESELEELSSRKKYTFFEGTRRPEDIDPLEQKERIRYLIRRIRVHFDYVEIELNKPEECNGLLNELIQRYEGASVQKDLKNILYPKIFRVPVMLKYQPSKRHTVCLVPERFAVRHLIKIRFQKRGGHYEIDWTAMSKFIPLAHGWFYFKNADMNKKYISRKRCRQCNEIKDIYDQGTGKPNFSRNKQIKDGWNSYCKSCTQNQRDKKKAELKG